MTKTRRAGFSKKRRRGGRKTMKRRGRKRRTRVKRRGRKRSSRRRRGGAGTTHNSSNKKAGWTIPNCSYGESGFSTPFCQDATDDFHNPYMETLEQGAVWDTVTKEGKKWPTFSANYDWMKFNKKQREKIYGKTLVEKGDHYMDSKGWAKQMKIVNSQKERSNVIN